MHDEFPMYLPPEEVRLSTAVWSGASNIDLGSGQASLARAGFEARVVGQQSGLDRTYPGFDSAIDSSIKSGIEETWKRGAMVGTLLVHINAIDGTLSDFVVEFCALETEVAVRRGDEYSSWRSRGQPSAMHFRANSDTSVLPARMSPTLSDSPYWQAPSYNVFEGWSIAPAKLPSEESCAPWALSIDPSLPAQSERVSRASPPQARPAYPGWPTDPPTTAPSTSTTTPR